MKKLLLSTVLTLSLGFVACQEKTPEHQAEYKQNFDHAFNLYMKEGNPDSAFVVCEQMKEKGLCETDEQLLSVLMAQTKICSLNRDFPQLLKFAEEAMPLAIQLGEQEAEADLKCRTGYALWDIGMRREGLERVHEGIDILKNPVTLRGLNGYFSSYKRLIKIYESMERYQDALDGVDVLLKRLEEVRDHPEKFEVIEAGGDSAANNHYFKFYNFYCGQMHCMRARQLLLMNKKEEAAEAAIKAEESEWIKNPNSVAMMIGIWADLGQIEKFQKALPTAVEYLSKDTLSSEYIDLLELQARILESEGKSASADRLHLQAQELQVAQLKQREQEQLINLASVYRLKESEAHNNSLLHSRFRWMNFTVVLFILVVLLTALLVNRRYRRKRRLMLYRLATGRSAVAVPEEDSNEGQEEPMEPESAADAMEADSNAVSVRSQAGASRIDIDAARNELYARIQEYMVNEEPYLDPDFDRAELARVMNSNTSYVSQSINSQGKTFTLWLAEYRVRKAISIIQSHPNIAVRELSVQSGVLNPVVFNRQFRSVTGMTVSEFKSQARKE